MTRPFTIEADWEHLDQGDPEERACFAALGIRCGSLWLTQAEDSFVNRVREKVHLSAYRLAEWLAWNWWRQRWEPRTKGLEWSLAHVMAGIGGGYVWPNITIISDGERTTLLTKPTERRPTEPLRYIIDNATILPTGMYESAVDLFIEQVRGQLRAEGVRQTNLDLVWTEVVAERADPDAYIRRRFEATLGCDPDDASPQSIEQLVEDARELGTSAMMEVAADKPFANGICSAAELADLASSQGFDASPKDAVRLRASGDLPRMGEIAAWRRGAIAAKELRLQEGLGASPISNARLAEMAGVSAEVLPSTKRSTALSFALDDRKVHGRLVLRSKWEAGRRFDLARIIGDRVASIDGGGRLFPATRAFTYRQKAQRSFAAEFLSPYEVVSAMLAGDLSEERIEEVASHFTVSERTIRTLLVNHGQIDRDDLLAEADSPMAA